MNTKVLLVCSILLLASSTQAQSTCILSSLSALLCPTSTCTLDATLLTTLCTTFGGSPWILNLNIQDAYTVNINGGSTFSVAGLNVNSTASASATINLSSAVNIAGDLIITGNAVVHAATAAVVAVSGKIQVAAQATLDIAGNVTAQGAVLIYGNLHLAGSTVNSAAQTAWLVATTTTVSFQGSASASAYLTGNGGIDASVALTDNVTIATGNSPGIVYVNGDFSMSGTTTLEIDVDSLTSFDRLIIKGIFKRSGILFADFETSYVPDSGTRFLFATHADSSGTFSISHGNLGDSTFSNVHPKYVSISTSFEYGSAANIVIPFLLIALCLLSIVF